MATSNRLLPVMAGVVSIIGAVILIQKCSGSAAVRSGSTLSSVPQAPTTEDGDTMAESLRTVTTSNNQLREDVQRLIAQNESIMAENRRLESRNRSQTPAAVPTRAQEDVDALVDLGSAPGTTDTVDVSPSPFSSITRAIDSASSSVTGGAQRAATRVEDVRNAVQDTPPGRFVAERMPDEPVGHVSYRPVPPMGYTAMVETGKGKAPLTRYVRTSGGVADAQVASAQQAVQRANRRPVDAPYFTLPDNSTLVDVTAMTAIIGRVPIDGRVTDPMQFKAIVGRENLAANRWQLPGDIEGMIVSGIAVGDMALSCSEGLIQSITFIFNDGTVRTVEARQTNTASINTASGTRRNNYLGYISDQHGNPCIIGKFVTNAPRYLTDIVGLKALQVAGQQFANAQTTTNQTSDGGFTSAVTGSRTDYVMGSAAASAANEVSDWLLSRLRNSFDAVVTPAGASIAVHLTQEVRLDKAANARKIVHQQQASTSFQRGGHYGLE